jgi:molybdate transport system ATP-binding protein
VSVVVEIGHVVGDFHLDVRVHLSSGLTALVGPSGSGKTTLLNVVAGLTRPKHAVILLHDDVLADTGTQTWLPSHRRHIGYVFQDPRLFPHLTVRQNLLYGRWFNHAGRDAIEPDEVIDLLNLSALLPRRPSRLSGGEQQRVALGRALLTSPRLLLLDEPLASIDQAHRLEILPYLDRLRAAHKMPVVYVTHTWAEVAARADHVLQLEAGKVVFNGTVAEAPKAFQRSNSAG